MQRWLRGHCVIATCIRSSGLESQFCKGAWLLDYNKHLAFFVISVQTLSMYLLKMVIFDMVKWGRVHYSGSSTPWCVYNNLYTNCPLLHQKVSNSLIWANIFPSQLKQGAWLKQWTILPGHTLLKTSETKLHCTNLMKLQNCKNVILFLKFDVLLPKQAVGFVQMFVTAVGAIIKMLKYIAACPG